MRSRWIEHRGKRILQADYTNLGGDHHAVQVEADYVVALARREPRDSVLTLSLVTGTTGTQEVVAVLKATAEAITPFARKRAVVGLTPLQRVFLNFINRFAAGKQFQVFSQVGEAMDWLAAD
jgi:hypothetical protein